MAAEVIANQSATPGGWRRFLARLKSAAFLCAAVLFATESAILAAETATPAACTGDCDATGSVGIDELLIFVNISLGNAQLAACPRGVPAGAEVDITLIIRAVNNAMNGCGGDRCLVASGSAAATCARQYAAAIAACRNEADEACEDALGGGTGTLATLLAATEEPVRSNCTLDTASQLTFLAGLDDLVSRTAQACKKWGKDLIATTYANFPEPPAPETLACQQVVGAQLATLHDEVVQAYGPGCYVRAFNGGFCDRGIRGYRVAQARAQAAAIIEPACGPTFDTLGLVPLTASPTVAGRIGVLMDTVVAHARQLAQRVYPPLDLGPTGLFGAFPVGVRTVDLVDPARLDVAGTGPRPVRVALYYPSTIEAVAGAPRDVVTIFGTELFVTPSFRDVDRAPGLFPLILFSGGNGADPWNWVYLAAHLVSHGFIVAGVEHHGDHAFDYTDANFAVNRPLDLRVVLDQLLAFDGEAGHFLAGAIDADRIGVAGHSAGGYTVMALAMCPFSLGAFDDPRVKAVFSMDPNVTPFLADQSAAVFAALDIPTLLVGGTLSRFTAQPPFVFDALEPGPRVLAFANLTDAVHETFSGDTCEVPDRILAATGGPAPECEPGTIPWRHARHIINYLALNFFDATLNDNAEALARLDPPPLSRATEDFTYESKTGDCPPGGSCSLTCEAAACGDGVVGAHEVCDPAGEQGECAAGDVCNDNCTACVTCGAATIIPPEGGVVAGTTAGGSSAFGGSCGGAVFAPERVFQWTPTVSHDASISLCGSPFATNFDSVLYVREGTCVGPELACNDDGGSFMCGRASR
ncbi:hypothetical protein L6Q96_08640, partial [Candidatus Binatia bacterium]|nr:hypothetical protein [Candidatus Binatia bacterium]